MAESNKRHLRLVDTAGAYAMEAGRRLQSSGGGGTFDGMEARVARLESDLGHIRTDTADIKVDVRGLRGDARTDFRVLFGAMIVAVLGLAGLMARGFGWL